MAENFTLIITFTEITCKTIFEILKEKVKEK